MRLERLRLVLVALALLATNLLLVGVAPAHAVPPTGKHYLVALIFRDLDTNEPDAQLGCLRFMPGMACTETDDCGPWEFTERKGRHNSWVGVFDVEEDGTTVTVEFRGITERKGPGSSIAGTIYFPGFNRNGSFSGIQLRPALCLELAATDD